MTEAERRVWKGLMREAVREELAEQSCACGLSTESRAEMGHAFGLFKDLGDGDAGRGIERLRDNANFVLGLRRRAEKVGGLVVTGLVLALVGFLTLIGKLGVDAWLAGRGGNP